jgi:hypothetical protein
LYCYQIAGNSRAFSTVSATTKEWQKYPINGVDRVMERNDHARKVHFMFKRSRPLGAFYGQEATMPARCVLWSRSDHARKVRFMVNTEGSRLLRMRSTACLKFSRAGKHIEHRLKTSLLTKKTGVQWQPKSQPIFLSWFVFRFASSSDRIFGIEKRLSCTPESSPVN